MRFSQVADVWARVEAAPGRLEMAGYLAQLLASADKADVIPLVCLCQGILAPPHVGLELGLGERLAEAAIALVSGKSQKELQARFNQCGDWGQTAEWALAKKSQLSLSSHELALSEVFESLVRLAKLSGPGSQDGKIKTLAELLNSSTPLEARYIVRFCVGKLRLGVQEPTLIDALALVRVPLVKEQIRGLQTLPDKKFQKIKIKQFGLGKNDEEPADSNASLEMVVEFDEVEPLAIPDGSGVNLVLANDGSLPLVCQKMRPLKEGNFHKLVLMGFKKAVRAPLERAFNLSSDLGRVAELALFDYPQIERFPISLFSPIRPALAERLADPAAIVEKLGPHAAEGKYDGFRLQVHKDGEHVELYSRKQERVTPAFPEIAQAALKLPAQHLIFEGEALGFDPVDGRFYPFQVTIQRKRKHGVGDMSKQIPLRLFAFDLLYADGVDWTRVPYGERRQALERLVAGVEGVEMSKLKMVHTPAELENFFDDCIRKGLEGIISKDLSAPYTPGAREFAWIKLKKSYGALADTLDVAIIGYYRGEGTRAAFNFGGLLVAVRDEQSGTLQSVARVGSGFSEEEMAEFAERLGALKVDGKPPRVDSAVEPDFWVEPKLVATVSADEISLSTQHRAGWAGDRGYALRFPRLLSLREDKGVDDITTVAEVEKLYSLQKSKLQRG